MTKRNNLLGFVLFVASTMFMSGLATAQTREQGPWWPHPIWGAEDQAGGSNWITPEKVLESLSVVRTGKVYELGFPYYRGMPLFGQRTYSMVLPGVPTGGPYDGSDMVYNDEFVCAEIGQIGTQFDGPDHIGRRMTMADGTVQNVFYNGFTQQEIQSPYELQNLGIENVKPIITRGVLINIAGSMGVETLSDSYVITLNDVKNALEKQGIEESSIKPGDALFFNTGWWHLIDDTERYMSFTWSGLGTEVVEWIIDKKVSMTGFDASGDPQGGTSVHFKLIMENGIFSHEFMTFEELLADDVHEFLFIFAPTRFTGATGSPGRPIAIR